MKEHLKNTIRMKINVAKSPTAKDEKQIGGNTIMNKVSSPRKSGRAVETSFHPLILHFSVRIRIL